MAGVSGCCVPPGGGEEDRLVEVGFPGGMGGTEAARVERGWASCPACVGWLIRSPGFLRSVGGHTNRDRFVSISYANLDGVVDLFAVVGAVSVWVEGEFFLPVETKRKARGVVDSNSLCVVEHATFEDGGVDNGLNLSGYLQPAGEKHGCAVLGAPVDRHWDGVLWVAEQRRDPASEVETHVGSGYDAQDSCIDGHQTCINRNCLALGYEVTLKVGLD